MLLPVPEHCWKLVGLLWPVDPRLTLYASAACVEEQAELPKSWPNTVSFEH